MRHGIRQSDLANIMGYEQSFISALEIGSKGPPTQEFVAKLISALDLDEEEQAVLSQAVEESRRKFVLPNDSSPEVYKMCAELWASMERLHPAQIQMIREVIRLKDRITNVIRPERGRVIRQQTKETAM
jgi:transcriptional regulator with XRE-family HTH domain